MLDYYRSFLESHPLTSAFEGEQRDRLLKAIHPHSVAVQDHIFQQEDRADCFYLVVSGLVKLYRVSQEGQEKVIEIVQPGMSFAEAVMFMERPVFPVNAQAIKPTEVLAVSSPVYRELLQENPQSAFRLMGDLSIRLHKRLNEIETLTLQNATYRVIRYFLANLPKEADDGCSIQLPASKRLIASHLAIQPETFSRILAKLKDEGIIEVAAREIRINSLDALYDYQ